MLLYGNDALKVEALVASGQCSVRFPQKFIYWNRKEREKKKKFGLDKSLF